MGRHWLATTVPRMSEVSIDARVLGVALAISIACGVLFGVVPAMRAARGDLVTGLRDGGRGVMGSVTHDRVRRTLIIAEIALSFMLLATSGLLVRSFMKLMAVPTGFDAGALMSFRTWLPPTRYPDSLSQVALWNRLTAQLGQTLGPRDVSITSDLPVGGGTDGSVTIEGKGMADGDMPTAQKRIVGNNYFDVLRARMVMGRSFQATDVLGAPPVVVVNQAFANRVLRGENPIGKRVGFDWGITGLQTIVGVVADVREVALDMPPQPAIYISQSQRPSYAMSVLLRTARPESDVAAIVRAALRSVDPALPMIELRPMSDVIIAGVQQRRVTAIVLAAFALNALLLAGVGLYGVISYSVAQRTQELGIRAALGAQRRHLVRLVLGQSVAFTAAGVVLGVAGSLAAGRLVANQLFAVRQSDPVVFAAVALILAAVAVAASAIPTLRATRADPLEALRAD
jgi:putative ABC transport system permease protein